MSLDRHTRTALKRELARAEEEQKRLAVVVTYLKERLRDADEESRPPVEPEGAATQRQATPRRPISGSRITAAQAAEKVLSDTGRWMKTPELLPRVQAAGAKIKDATNLYKTLDRNPAFRRKDRGMWGLAEWPDHLRPVEPLFPGEVSGVR